ncbi:MAG: isoleucine--tRNA ligase [Verrucomicrobia bacterium]|nr:isoleucine--tRNA ligase [Verrucomicrobiota bacterium]
MEYKNTLNLPRTDFPMKADLVTREPERLARWRNERLYEAIQTSRAQRPAFVLHDGPPFANGDVHIGTALNKIVKDFVIRHKTLAGYRAPYVPGWDCHGLPIEFKVSQELRKAGQTAADPATIRNACDAYARKYIELQRTQFQRLGVLGEWAKPYLTLDKGYEAEELRLFADIVAKGFVYRGRKPVYWSIPCRTALAEAEVEYRDHISQSVYVKFPIVGQPGCFILIWTTTPWTLPANLAVAFNSSFSYLRIRATGADGGAEDYLIAATLLDSVAAKCGWRNWVTVATLVGADLADLIYQHPFCQRTGNLHAGDEFVDSATGTGFVHIAPGHGLEDYHLGNRVGLPVYSPVDDEGCFIHTKDLPVEQQMPAEMLGKSILEKHGKSEANEAVLHELRVRRALLHQENYHHSYPHCWRSKTPVIFRGMDQWFIRVDHVPQAVADVPDLQPRSHFEEGVGQPPAPASSPVPEPPPAMPFRQLALQTIGEVGWVPDWGVNRIRAAVESRPDWCISRQRAWGVPIPAFYDPEGNPILDARIIRAVADLVAQHGSNVWFERTVTELWRAVRPADWMGPEAATKSADTLDVWIDSGSSSRAVLQSRPELLKPVGRRVKAGEDAGFVKLRLEGFPNTFILVPLGSAQELPASLVVAFDEGAFFSLFRSGGDSFIASALDVAGLVQACGLPGYELIRSVHGEELEHYRALHPDTGQPLRLVAAPAEGVAEARESGFWFADWQADMYLEGSDQHRGWFQSSLLLSLAGNGAPPFKTVLTHGFMVDADREKISKSKQGQGGYEKPQTAERYIKEYGADVLRLWVASQDFRNDIVVSEERLKKVGEAYRMLRNTLRYQLSNLYDFDPREHSVADADLTGLDRWILSEFARLEAEVHQAYEAADFHVVYQRLTQFASVELSAVYHDIVKDRLYTDPADSRRRRSTQTALYRLVTRLCQMLSPMLVFTADEAWEFIPGRPCSSVHLSVWQPEPFEFGDAERALWRGLFALREAALPELEAARQAKLIGKSLDASVTVRGPSSTVAGARADSRVLQELLNVSHLEIEADESQKGVTFKVGKAAGQKCERCWHWERDVGTDPAQPTICGRCAEAVRGRARCGLGSEG